MSSFLERNVLITGGAGGLGELLARKSLEKGAKRAILWDIDRQRLNNTADRLKQYRNPVAIDTVDLTNPDQIVDKADQLLERIGSVDILFNNAGIVIGKSFENCTHKEIQAVIELNVLGVMHTARAFLPAMIRNGFGHIINISSASSLLGNPQMSVYAGSKWAVTGWSESLRLELEQQGLPVRMLTVQPGYIDTGMFRGAEPPLFTPLLKPDEICDKIIRAVQEDKTILREPFMVKLIPFLRGVLPRRLFDLVAGQLFGVYSSMNSFKGR